MKLTLRILVVLIAAVAVYDIYCTVSLHDSILHCEENPIALWLCKRTYTTLYTFDSRDEETSIPIVVKGVDVSLLVAAKAAGLSFAIPLMMYVISTKRESIAAAIILPVALGSLILLAKLVH